MRSRSPQKDVAVFADKWGTVADDLADRIATLIAGGTPIGEAIEIATVGLGARERLQAALLEGLYASVAAGVSQAAAGNLKLAERTMWLNKLWPGERVKLSTKITEAANLEGVKESLRKSMRLQKSFAAAAMDLTDKNLTAADVNKTIDALGDMARRLGGDAATNAEFRATLSDARRQIARLGKAGAPNQRLKLAYKNLADSAEKLSGKALDNAIRRTVAEKARYNAERIARTEMARAYSQGVYAEAKADEDVIGIKYLLSARHPDPDICDFHTSANLFGLGPGCYPLEHLPEYPFHPHCMCNTVYVYSGTAQRIDPSEGSKLIERMSETKRKALLGVDGAQEFERRPLSWQKNLRNYTGHKSIDDLYYPQLAKVTK